MYCLITPGILNMPLPEQLMGLLSHTTPLLPLMVKIPLAHVLHKGIQLVAILHPATPRLAKGKIPLKDGLLAKLLFGLPGTHQANSTPIHPALLQTAQIREEAPHRILLQDLILTSIPSVPHTQDGQAMILSLIYSTCFSRKKRPLKICSQKPKRILALM